MERRSDDRRLHSPSPVGQQPRVHRALEQANDQARRPRALGGPRSNCGRDRRRQHASGGLVEYFAFIARFDELLTRASGVSELTGTFWLYHAYWFEQIGEKVGSGLGEILDTVGRWSIDNKSDLDVSGLASTPDMSDLAGAVRRLTKGPAAYPPRGIGN